MRIGFLQKKETIDISVVVIFFNMRREARRTLYSLTRQYQRNTDGINYEVIAIDNGSSEPLDEDYVKNLGDNFRYYYFKTTIPSPCEALNYGVKISRGKLVTLCIDGARILSPGILQYSLQASRTSKNPFVYTLGMHIGHKVQNYLAEENYSQLDEDKLLSTIDWEQDGYSLFDISSVALSGGKGYLSKISESNCFSMLKSTFINLGGFDANFKSPGGGLVNLDFFNRAHQLPGINPILLLGEATFHQFHGGTATNVAMKDHPWNKMAAEYLAIRGIPFNHYHSPPIFFGKIDQRSHRLFVFSE